MKFIAHRGLLDGPNASLENNPSHISQVINSGVDVEVDVWYVNHNWWLGHDAPTHQIGFHFLNSPQLWIHAKNFEAADKLITLSRTGNNHNFFWHDKDDRTLTSWGFWWTYPLKDLGVSSVMVMPEWHTPVEKLKQLLSTPCHAICTDWVNHLK